MPLAISLRGVRRTGASVSIDLDFENNNWRDDIYGHITSIELFSDLGSNHRANMTVGGNSMGNAYASFHVPLKVRLAIVATFSDVAEEVAKGQLLRVHIALYLKGQSSYHGQEEAFHDFRDFPI